MMRRLLVLLFLITAAPALAVSTTSVTLTTSWQDLGAGPMQIQTNNQSQTLYQIADTAPASTAGGFFLQGNGAPQTVATSSHVFVRARTVPAKGAAPIVLYAPVSSSAGGGASGGTSNAAITSPVGSNTKANSVSTTFATDFLGQTTMAGSLPVVLASNQSAVPVNQGAPATAANAWPSVLTQGGALLTNINPLPVLQLDTRGTGTLTATNGQLVNIPLNGTSSLGLTVSGITSNAATLTFNTSNDGGTTYLAKGAINCSAPGANPTSLTADGQTRIDVAGATNVQLKVTAGTGGTINYSYNLSAAPVACPNVPTLANQGAPAVVANAWPTVVTQGGAVLSSTNGLPTTDTNASQTITSPGTAATKAQAVQGVAGATPIPVTALQGGAANTAANPFFVTGNIAQWAGTTLGAPTTYGTAPTGSVIGVNAFVTNFPAQQSAAEAGSSAAATGIAPVVTTSGTTAVGKSSQGNLYSAYAINTTTTAGYLVLINATAAPASGAAITPVDVATLGGTVGATAAINYGAGPPNAYPTGIVALVTTSLTTYTPGGASFIQVRVR